jgi:hypothetical protein
MALYAGGVASGQPKEQGIVSSQSHWFTPETTTSSHYFYGAGVPKSLGPQAEMIAKETVAALAQPFEFEDKPIIEAQQKSLCGRDITGYGGVILDIDAAGVHARRILAKLIATEAEE